MCLKNGSVGPARPCCFPVLKGCGKGRRGLPCLYSFQKPATTSIIVPKHYDYNFFFNAFRRDVWHRRGMKCGCAGQAMLGEMCLKNGSVGPARPCSFPLWEVFWVRSDENSKSCKTVFFLEVLDATKVATLWAVCLGVGLCAKSYKIVEKLVWSDQKQESFSVDSGVTFDIGAGGNVSQKWVRWAGQAMLFPCFEGLW